METLHLSCGGETPWQSVWERKADVVVNSQLTILLRLFCNNYRHEAPLYCEETDPSLPQYTDKWHKLCGHLNECTKAFDFNWLPSSLLQGHPIPCFVFSPVREGPRTTVWELRLHFILSHTISGNEMTQKFLLLILGVEQWPFQVLNLCWYLECNNSLFEFFS